MVDISVIVPTWNVSGFICDCLDSILAQRHVSLEIIVLNCAGTDDTERLIREYAEEYDCVKPVFLPASSGLAERRNLGIQMAQGEFIAFCDADDVLPDDKNVYYSMLNQAHKENADLVVGNYYRENDGEIRKDSFSGSGLARCVERVNMALWNKLFRREFIQKYDISIPLGIDSFEDAIFCTAFLMQKPRISDTDRYVYVYRESRPNDSEKIQGSHDRRYERVVHDFRALEWVSCQKFDSELDLWQELFFQMLNVIFGFIWMPMSNAADKKKAYIALQETLQSIQENSIVGRIDTPDKDNRFRAIFGVSYLEFNSLTYEQFILFRLLKGESVFGATNRPRGEDFVRMCYNGEIGLRMLFRCFKGWLAYKIKRKKQ